MKEVGDSITSAVTAASTTSEIIVATNTRIVARATKAVMISAKSEQANNKDNAHTFTPIISVAGNFALFAGSAN